MEIREARPGEHETLGTLTVQAYQPFGVTEDGYGDELADVSTRAEQAVVLVAVGDDGALLGGITYVPPGENPMHEHDEELQSTIRMLAVADRARRQGVGAELSQAAIERAKADGARGMVLHSASNMFAAHRLYAGLGFERDTSLDWSPSEGVELLGFRLRF